MEMVEAQATGGAKEIENRTYSVCKTTKLNSHWCLLFVIFKFELDSHDRLLLVSLLYTQSTTEADGSQLFLLLHMLV